MSDIGMERRGGEGRGEKREVEQRKMQRSEVK